MSVSSSRLKKFPSGNKKNLIRSLTLAKVRCSVHVPAHSTAHWSFAKVILT